MTSLQTAIDQNNTTVSFLQQQDIPNAIESSFAAMRLLQELQRKSPSDILSYCATVACAPDCLDQCMLLSYANTDGKNTSDPYLENTTPFVYEQGIVIPSTAMKYEVVSAILMFNSALAHHLYAQQQHQDKATSQTYLFKSKRLYELAFDLCTDYRVIQENVLFQFTIFNNIAVIELQTGNVALSTRYFENLASILMLLVDRGCRSKLYHLRGFLRNVPLKVAAASAA